jgi:monoamine oxidase
MYDVAIVGAGLSGLALAEILEAQGQSVVVIEARERLGGRILTRAAAGSGLPIDLGATWFWPQRQPLLAALVQRLGLSAFPQRDEGTNLSLTDPAKGARGAGMLPVHGGAHRIAGGMAELAHALAARLRRTEIRLGAVVQAILDEGTHLRLAWCSPDGGGETLARRCVLALPPRLVSSLTFSPALDRATLSALQHTPTWMAAAAKVGAACASPDWRQAGLSGSAFINHGQAVLAEIWDACDATAEHAGLGGFLALSPDQRREFVAGLPMLIASQFSQVFGQDMEMREQHYQDWAAEAFTCAAADLAQAPDDHPNVADRLLRCAHWDDKLYFAGAETAAREPGYLEGALESASRVAQAMRASGERAEILARPGNTSAALAFGKWIDERRAAAFAAYRTALAESLMRQEREQLTQRALLVAVESVFADALIQLDRLSFDVSGASVERGRSNLLPAVQAPFKPFLDGLLEEIFAFNATSCALSNFPDEHRPPRDYRNTMLRDIAAAWIEFSRAANAMLLRAHLQGGAGSISRPDSTEAA